MWGRATGHDSLRVTEHPIVLPLRDPWYCSTALVVQLHVAPGTVALTHEYYVQLLEQANNVATSSLVRWLASAATLGSARVLGDPKGARAVLGATFPHTSHAGTVEAMFSWGGGGPTQAEWKASRKFLRNGQRLPGGLSVQNALTARCYIKVAAAKELYNSCRDTMSEWGVRLLGHALRLGTPHLTTNVPSSIILLLPH